MRVTQIYVKDAPCVKSYAYSESQNCRDCMEDNFLLCEGIAGGNMLFGVLDGHGGTYVSEFAVEAIPKLFKDFQASHPEANVKKLFEKVCVAVDQQLSEENGGSTGSTLCLAYVTAGPKRMCYVANLGDTRAVLYEEGKAPRRITVDHKLDNPSQFDRVKSVKDSLIFNHRVGGQLAITRALGDLHLKSYGVSNIPEYDEFEVTASTKLLIMASDGLWDVCEDHFAVDICRNLTEPNQMAKKLVDMAIDEGSRDNVSVMIIEF